MSRNGLRGDPSVVENRPKRDQKGDPRWPEGGASRSASWGQQVRCHTWRWRGAPAGGVRAAPGEGSVPGRPLLGGPTGDRGRSAEAASAPPNRRARGRGPAGPGSSAPPAAAGGPGGAAAPGTPGASEAPGAPGRGEPGPLPAGPGGRRVSGAGMRREEPRGAEGPGWPRSGGGRAL